MKISSKKFLILFNVLGAMVVISSPSWTGMWLGMEIMSMTIPPIMLVTDSSILSKINSWKYYMVQCYSSSIFLMCVICLSLSHQNWMNSNFLWVMITISMILKMGVIPFHGWLFHLSNSIQWKVFLILSSIQKIGPLIVISEMSKIMSEKMSYEMILSATISVLSISGMWVNSVRYIFVVSSMINIAWMISSTQVSKSSFLLFMLFYFLHLFVMFLLLEKENSNLVDGIILSSKKWFSYEIMKSIIFLSLIGMPPLIGFFIKLSILEQLIYSESWFTAIVLTLSSSVIMPMYLKLMVISLNSMRISYTQVKNSTSFFLSVVIILVSPVLFLG